MHCAHPPVPVSFTATMTARWSKDLARKATLYQKSMAAVQDLGRSTVKGRFVKALWQIICYFFLSSSQRGSQLAGWLAGFFQPALHPLPPSTCLSSSPAAQRATRGDTFRILCIFVFSPKFSKNVHFVNVFSRIFCALFFFSSAFFAFLRIFFPL